MGDKRSWDLRRPLGAKSMWVAAGGAVLVTAFLLASLHTDLRLDAGHTAAGVRVMMWCLVASTWSLALLYYLALARFVPPPSTVERAASLQHSLWQEAHAMAQFALERGRTPAAVDLAALQRVSSVLATDETPPPLVSDADLEDLVRAHERLTALVTPATPRTLALLMSGARAHPLWLGQVRLVRMMLGLATALLPVFVALALGVGTRLDSPSHLFDGDIVDRTRTACYLLVASALGAAFASLFRARRYLENFSYDELYEASYWVRFVQGLLAGLILAVLLSQTLPESHPAFRVGVPLLALVGGFSSDLVYRVLNRVLDAVEALFRGSTDEVLDEQRERSETRLRHARQTAEQDTRTALLERRHEEVVSLLTFADLLPTDGSTDEARRALDKRIAALLAGTEPASRL